MERRYIGEDSATEEQLAARKDSKNHSDDAEYFAKGDIDAKKYHIVNINTFYDYTYKNMETGRRTTVTRSNYYNLKTMKYKFRKSVWGTRKFYSDARTGKLNEYWKNPTAGYGELMKMDPQLEYESNVFAACVGGVGFSLLFILFAWIVRKITLAMVGKCTKKTKTIKHLDIDVPCQDWNVNDMSTKKEFKAESENTDPSIPSALTV